MTRKIAPLLALALVVVGCGRSGKMHRDQKQYEVVEEGSASGVTSTINAPGETKPPVTATDTNADTTTNFTVPNPDPLGSDSAAKAALGEIPPATQTATPRITRPRVTETVAPEPKPRHVEPAPETDTTGTSATTSTTDTTETTTTAPPPPPPTDTRG